MKNRTDLWGLPIRFAKGVGPRRALFLEKLGVKTIEEALWFIPWRYEDWSVIVPIGRLEAEMQVTVEGTVSSCRVRRTSRKGMIILTICIDDGTGTLEAVFFNQPFLEQVFKPGTRVRFRGEAVIKSTGFSAIQMQSPQHEIIHSVGDHSTKPTSLIPVYHETKGLSSRQIRRIVKGLWDQYGQSIEEILPLDFIHELHLPSLKDSISELHFPENPDSLNQLNEGTTPWHQRMAFEELLLLQLALALRRHNGKMVQDGIVFSTSRPLIEKYRTLLPFPLTSSQERVIREITKDMHSTQSMNRLLQGDVGSGKTLVALQAMIMAVGSGYQAALMAPTEVLSEQHFFTIEPYLKQLGITTVLLKGGQSVGKRIRTLGELASGDVQVVVGTHALLQPEVVFSKLGLVVVDEQHKFGVVQRAQLKKKGIKPPDVLVMTATPIPRTLAMTVYGDLDVSVIDELPPGRKPVQTLLFHEGDRIRAYDHVRREIKAGRQAYIVYPLVEPSEKVDLHAAVQAAELLQREEFPELNIGLLHGRMKSKEKQAIMSAFKEGDIHILVATTVIEVGVDVPNATVIVIEHAERFGLAQLHQLRGRVGRGKEQALCLLVRSNTKSIVGDNASSTRPQLPFSSNASASGNGTNSEACEEGQYENRRLKVFVQCHDGFALAEEDLKIRGPGNVLGVQQWGAVDFRVAQLLRDHHLMVESKRMASQCIAQDSGLNSLKFQALKSAVLRKWGKTFELGSIG